MEKGLFSIIIPTFNRTDFLKQALGSVLKQTYNHFEVIVIDDGSQENVEKLVLSYGDKVKYFRQDNKGVSAARNLGISKASGEFISFLDDDDLFYPDKLQVNLKYFSEYPSAAMVCSGFCFIDKNGNKVLRKEVLPEKPNISLHNIAMFDLIHTSSVVVRAEILINTSGFNDGQKISEDYALWSEVLKIGEGIAIPEVLTQFRQHQGNTKLPSWKVYKENIKIIKNIFESGVRMPYDIHHYSGNLKKIIIDNLLFKKRYIERLCFLARVKLYDEI